MRTRPYKHKLNLLEPGTVLCKAIGGFGLPGAVLYALGCGTAACVLLGMAGLLLLVLLLLLGVEQYQDRVMLEIAKREDAAHAGEQNSRSGYPRTE